MLWDMSTVKADKGVNAALDSKIGGESQWSGTNSISVYSEEHYVNAIENVSNQETTSVNNNTYIKVSKNYCKTQVSLRNLTT